MGILIYSYLTFFTKHNDALKISAASNSATLTTKGEWEQGTLVSIDSTTVSGSISIASPTKGRYLLADDSEVVDLSIDYIADNDTMTSSDNNFPTTNYQALNLLGPQTVTQAKWNIGRFVGDESEEIEYYDGSTWHFIANVSLWSAWETYDFSPAVTMTRIRGLITGGTRTDIKELQVFNGLTQLYAPSSATHTSTATQLDAGAHTTMNWTTFAPSGTVNPPTTSINFRFRTSPDSIDWSAPWTASTAYAASINIETLLGATDAAKRYLQVETTLANTDGASTPTLDDYTANYDYAVLDHIIVSPATATVQVNGTQAFTAVAYDDSNAVMPAATFSWSTDCGSIDGSGNYTAPATAGSCIVTAQSTVDGVTKSDTSDVTVTAAPLPTPTCFDGIQNQDETAVDCGGVCPACPAPPTCTDGIQNGDETGIDTGGSCGGGGIACTNINHLTVSPTTKTLTPNSNHIFAAKIFANDGSEITTGVIAWATSGPEGAPFGGGTLIGNGNHSVKYVAPAALGNYSLTASLCNKTVTAAITVIAGPSPPISIAISASPDEVVLKPGQTQQYSATVSDQDGKDITSICPVTWSMQTPAAGSINSAGLMTSTSSSGTWRDTVKAETNCFGLIDFELLSFVTTNETRVLDYVSIYLPTTTVIKKGVTSDTANFVAAGLDQFGMRFGEEVTWGWDLLDKRAGELQQNSNKSHLASVNTSNNYGCYKFKVKDSGTYGGKTLSNYTSLSIYPPDFPQKTITNSSYLDSSNGSTSQGQASATDQGSVLSSISTDEHIYLRPEQTEYFYTNARDQFGNSVAHKSQFSLLDPNSGSLSSSGQFIATATPGTYIDAIEIKAIAGNIVLSKKVTVTIANEKRKALKLYASSPVRVGPNSASWIYVGLKDQFNDTYQVFTYVNTENVSGQNLFSIQNHTVLEANGKEGTWKNAIKITLDLEKLNRSIYNDENKFEGPAPELYLDLKIDNSFNDPLTCLSQSYCDPDIEDCAGAGGGGGDGGTIIGGIIDSIIDNLLAVAALAAALLLSLLALGASALVSLLAFIHPSQLLALLLKGRDKKRAMGIVYDSASGLGIPLAKVLLFRARDKKLQKIAVSDRDGKFALDTPAGEEYYIIVEKEGFDPLKPLAADAGLAYENNYFGTVFATSDQIPVFNRPIPMKANATAVNFAKGMRLFEKIAKVLRIINIPILLFGFTMTVIIIRQDASIFNKVILAVYILIFIYYGYKLIAKKGRSKGLVYKTADKSPVDLAVVRAINEADGKLVKTSVTNVRGNYTLQLKKGFYKILVTKPGLEANSLTQRVSSNYISLNNRIGLSEIRGQNDLTQQTEIAPVSTVAKRVAADSTEIIERFKQKQAKFGTVNLADAGVHHLIQSTEPRTKNGEPRSSDISQRKEISKNKTVYPNWNLPDSNTPL